MPVDSEAIAYTKAKPGWQIVRDTVAGEPQVKYRRTLYLPAPNPDDTSLGNQKRYAAYLTRACFVGYTGRTAEQLTGQVFAKAPVVEGLPDSFKAWLDDIDGGGVSFNQQARVTMSDVIQESRGFLFVDYPAVPDGERPSQEDVEKRGIRPRCLFYPCEALINWDVTQVGGKTVISLLVLKEEYSEADPADSFVKTRGCQYRVLRLEGGVYTWEIHRETGKGTKIYAVTDQGTPKKANGETWDVIPFQPIGALANTLNVEMPGLLSLALLNLAHYRNSADREESIYRNGQATAVVTGLDKEWMNSQLGGTIRLGAYGGLPLPKGADAKYMQAEANDAASEGMTDKEKQMKALGARFTEAQEVERTATESSDQSNTETSILAMMVANVENGYRQALLWMGEYSGEELDPEKVKVTLNKDYARPRMGAEELAGVINLRTAKLTTFGEARETLVRGGYATLDAKKAQEELEGETDQEVQRTLEETKALMDHKAAQKPDPAASK